MATYLGNNNSAFWRLTRVCQQLKRQAENFRSRNTIYCFHFSMNEAYKFMQQRERSWCFAESYTRNCSGQHQWLCGCNRIKWQLISINMKHKGKQPSGRPWPKWAQKVMKNVTQKGGTEQQLWKQRQTYGEDPNMSKCVRGTRTASGHINELYGAEHYSRDP
jgi:hypothetical protein